MPASQHTTSTKCCIRCHEAKPPDAYPSQLRNGVRRFTTYCKECRNKALRDKRKSDPEWQAKARATTNAWRRRPENLEKRRRKDRERYASDPEYRQRALISCRRTPEQNRYRTLSGKYGISVREYDALLTTQGGGCAICGRTENPGRFRQSLPVDHNHETGAIRGILCIDCNRGLGMFRDDPRLLRKAATYLENFVKESHRIVPKTRKAGGM
jgi:hypothetical protein